MIVDAVTAKVRKLREKWEGAGYEVIEHPAPEAFPLELRHFARLHRPSMLARKDGEHHVFEVRDPRRTSVARLTECIEEVRKHPGWHFYLVSTEDVVPHDAPGIQPAPPTWPELERTRGETMRAVPVLPGWMQLLALWTLLEGVLRRIAVDEGIPTDLLPAATLIPALYDYGLIPFESYEPLKAAHEVHRRVRHGFAATEEDVAKAVGAVNEWLPALLPTAVECAA